MIKIKHLFISNAWLSLLVSQHFLCSVSVHWSRRWVLEIPQRIRQSVWPRRKHIPKQSLLLYLVYSKEMSLEMFREGTKFKRCSISSKKIMGDIFSTVMKRWVFFMVIDSPKSWLISPFFFNIKRKSRCEECSFDSWKHVFYDHWDIFTKHWN